MAHINFYFSRIVSVFFVTSFGLRILPPPYCIFGMLSAIISKNSPLRVLLGCNFGSFNAFSAYSVFFGFYALCRGVVFFCLIGLFLSRFFGTILCVFFVRFLRVFCAFFYFFSVFFAIFCDFYSVVKVH